MSICHTLNYHRECKIVNTHDKFEEAHYFLHKMLENYHNANEFRFNLNAFIQALRNITFALQSEKHNLPDFDKWYELKQIEMKQSELLKNFVEGRNIVVKRGNLEVTSEAVVGMFRYRKSKLGMVIPVDPFSSSEILLKHYQESFIGLFIDKEHSAIGEQLGVQRVWKVDSIGETEIIQLCFDAWRKIGEVVKEAHDLVGLEFHIPLDCEENPEEYQILLETDLNPKLIKKWGWNI